jgi:hypothetical protein
LAQRVVIVTRLLFSASPASAAEGGGVARSSVSARPVRHDRAAETSMVNPDPSGSFDVTAR